MPIFSETRVFVTCCFYRWFSAFFSTLTTGLDKSLTMFTYLCIETWRGNLRPRFNQPIENTEHENPTTTRPRNRSAP